MEEARPPVACVTRRAFLGFDDFAESSPDDEILRRGQGPCAAERITADLGRVVLIWSFRTPAIIANATVAPDERMFLLRTDGHGPVLVNGHVLDRNRLLDHRPGTEVRVATSSSADVRLVKIVARPGDLDRISIKLTGARFSSGPSLCTLVEPEPWALDRLQTLCAGALNAINHPASLASEGFIGSLADAILGALVTTVSSDRGRKEGHDWAGDFQTRIIRRADAFLRAHPAQLVPTSVLCDAAAVNERQLQRAFHAVYVIGPSGYGKLRRLHLARRALRTAPRGTTVAEVGSRIGFSDLGRFASAYSALFGEAPSATLAEQRSGAPGVSHARHEAAVSRST
jgi:AraC-like DNA-binding protein